MFKKIHLFVICVICFISNSNAYSSKEDIQRIKKYYKIYKCDRKSFKVVKKKIYSFYTSSETINKVSINRILKNSKKLEYDPELYCIHSLVSYDLICNQKNHLDIYPIVHRLTLKVKKVKNLELKFHTENIIGNFYSDIKNYRQAIKYYNSALKKAIYNKDTINIQVIEYNIAGTYFKNDKIELSILHLKKAISFDKDKKSSTHVDHLIALTSIMIKCENYNEAFSILKKVETSINENQRGVFYNNLGLIYVHQKKYREAEKSFNISGVIVNKSEKHNLAILYDNLSNCYEHLNQYQLALKYLKKKNKCLDDEKRDIKINVFNELRRQDELKINVLKKKSNLQKIKLEKLKSNRLILFLVMLFIISALLISLLIFKNKKMKILVKLNIDNMQKVPENETKTIVNRKIPEKLVLQIEESITVDLIYIDPNITIQKMANLLETNVSDLSKAINSFYGMNFRTLINLKRVEYAKKMLLDNKYDNYSILGIAETVGYLNKASFYKNFKQLTGVTPANFQAIGKRIIENENSNTNYEEK